jgi:hypothetical protein
VVATIRPTSRSAAKEASIPKEPPAARTRPGGSLKTR